MFTEGQIKEAHSKVKSGTDFPAYIRDLKTLGVSHYETFVLDGHTEYYGANGHKVISSAKYYPLAIAADPDSIQFKIDLKSHQEGKTDYPTFCSEAAKSGVFKWAVQLNKMTCTYYDNSGSEILKEEIPQ